MTDFDLIIGIGFSRGAFQVRVLSAMIEKVSDRSTIFQALLKDCIGRPHLQRERDADSFVRITCLHRLESHSNFVDRLLLVPMSFTQTGNPTKRERHLWGRPALKRLPSPLPRPSRRLEHPDSGIPSTPCSESRKARMQCLVVRTEQVDKRESRYRWLNGSRGPSRRRM